MKLEIKSRQEKRIGEREGNNKIKRKKEIEEEKRKEKLAYEITQSR